MSSEFEAGELRVESVSMWKEFKNDPRFADFLNQLKARQSDIINDFRHGNIGTSTSLAKTYDDLRVRDNELEFVITLIDLIIESCEEAEKSRQKSISDDKENEDGRAEE